MNAMRFILILFPAFFLTGCVGFAVGSYGTFESKYEKFTLRAERNKFGYGDPKPYTTESVVEFWGKPDESFQEGKCTVYSYHDGFSWSGVGAFVLVIPIPLLVPTGNDEIRIYFRDNQSIAAVSEFGKETSVFGFLCGSNECGFRAGAVNTDIPRKVDVDWCD